MKALQHIHFTKAKFSAAPEAINVAARCQRSLYNLMWDRYQKSIRAGRKPREFAQQWDAEGFLANWTGYLLELALVVYLGLSHHAWVDIRLPKYQADPELDEHLPDLFPNIEVRTFNSGIKAKDLRTGRNGHKATDSIWVFGSCDNNGHGRFFGWLKGSDIFTHMRKGKADQYGKFDYHVIEANLEPMDTLKDYVYGPAILED